MTPDDVKARDTFSGSARATGQLQAAPTGDDAGFLVALEARAASRGVSRRLRQALAARISIEHANVLRAWQLGEENGAPVVAVERCAHPSLSDVLKSGPLDLGACERILAGAAAAAHVLGSQGLVVRDVTPDRVFAHPKHGGVLADLGIPPELLLRVPPEQDPGLPFHSPEELQGQPLDPRTTVYSLGVLLFAALTRTEPYEGSSSRVYSALLAGAAPRPSAGWSLLPPGINRVIARAISPDADQRYVDAEELARAVAGFARAKIRDIARSREVPAPKPPAQDDSLTGSPEASTVAHSPETPTGAGGRAERGRQLGRDGKRPARGRAGTQRIRRQKRVVVARASVKHPNIVPATAAADRGGDMRVVIEVCAAPALSELSRPLDGAECVRMVMGASAAISALARVGLFARDLTPDHIHFGAKRGALLSDTGLPLDLFPRPSVDSDPHLAYRAPEELNGAAPDFRSAVYSLGGLLFTALTGMAPFGGTWDQIYLGHIAAARPRPSEHRNGIAVALDTVVARAMAVDPTDRYAAPSELAAAVEKAVAASADAPRRTAKPKRAEGQARVQKRAAESPQPSGAEPAAAPDEAVGAAPRRPQGVRASVRDTLREERLIAAEHFVAAREQVKRRLRVATSVAPPLRRQLVRPAHERGTGWRGGLQGHWTQLSLLFVILLGIGGAVALADRGGDEGKPGPTRVRAGSLSFELPPDWREVDASARRVAAPLRARLAATTDRHGGASLAAGILGDAGNPDRVVRAVLPAGAHAERIQRGALDMLSYSAAQSTQDLARRGYVLYTSGPSAIVVCTARTPVGLRSCGRLTATVRIRGEHAVSPEVGVRRHDPLRALLSDLVAARVERRRALATAPVADEQIDAARSLEDVYQDAARRVRNSRLPTPATRALLEALDASAAAYANLAAAVAAGDPQAYDDARADVASAEADVWTGPGGLG
jgi:hypothetical protein